jgi:predicted DsbA family dithiol-disulfide isomerase
VSAPPLTVDVWSDVVCPWCYIGKRNFETALAELGNEIEVVVDYHAFELDPTAPPGVATPMPEVYAKKFGGPDAAREAIDRVTGVAARIGLAFHLDRAMRANTRMAHRLVWLAAQADSPASPATVNERLMRAYFSEGLNLGDPDTLAELAADLGFDRERVRAWLDSDAGVAEVTADLDQAGALGITAVPTFVFNDRWAVPGAQDAETFVNVLRRAHAKLAVAE